MIIVDTKAFLSISIAEILEKTIEHHQVCTTKEIISELEEIASKEDYLAEAATKTLQHKEKLNIHETGFERFRTSRIDSREASCLSLTREIKADFLLTDDLNAMAEIKKLSTTETAISPTLLQSMVKNNTISKQTAIQKLDKLAETRDWMETLIYQRAKNSLNKIYNFVKAGEIISKLGESSISSISLPSNHSSSLNLSS